MGGEKSMASGGPHPNIGPDRSPLNWAVAFFGNPICTQKSRPRCAKSSDQSYPLGRLELSVG